MVAGVASGRCGIDIARGMRSHGGTQGGLSEGGGRRGGRNGSRWRWRDPGGGRG